MAVDLKKTSEDGKREFKGIAAGIDAAKSSMSRMADTAKRGLTTAITLGGTFSLAAAVKSTLELDTKFRSLAFRAQTAGNRMATAADIQLTVDRSAAKASRTTEEMAEAFDQLFTSTGDLQGTKDALAGIAVTATGTGNSVEKLTGVAGTLTEKFGVAGNAMDGALATVIGNTGIGGPKLEEFAGIADTLGANLLEAGLRGEKGLRFMLGALNKVDDEMGGVGKSVNGVGKLLLNLGKGSEMKQMAKSLGIDPSKLINEKDAISRIMKILSFGKAGLATLKANFVGPEERKALRLLFTDPFEQALNRAKASGLKGKDAVDQALKVLESQIGDFGKTSLTAGDIAAKAAENQRTPAFQLTEALETLKRAVAQPEVITSLNQLAQNLPAMAKALGNFLGFAARNPLLAGTLGLAGNAGLSFLGGFSKELVRAVVSGHKMGGAEAATEIKGGLLDGLKSGSGVLATAGTAFGIAAAAVMAYQVGKTLIDAAVDPGLKKTRDVEGGTEAAIANAAGGGSSKQLEARLARLRTAMAAEEEEKPGSGFGAKFAGMFGGPDVEGLSKDRLARGGEAASDLTHRIREAKIREATDRASNMSMEPETVRGKVHLEAGAPRAIGVATADALGGRTLNVRIVSGGSGVSATGRSFGGRGPLALTPAAHGGGT